MVRKSPEEITHLLRLLITHLLRLLNRRPVTKNDGNCDEVGQRKGEGEGGGRDRDRGEGEGEGGGGGKTTEFTSEGRTRLSVLSRTS